MHSEDSKLLEIEEVREFKGCVENPLNGAHEIGCYSVDTQGDVRYDDRSQMKYYIPRKGKNLRLNLNAGYNDNTQYAHDNRKVMNNLFGWIKHSRFDPLHEHKIHFVCTRGVVKYLLNTPYDKEAHWTICACKLGDVIYLSIIDSQLEPSSEYNKIRAAWGLKFERYMTADSPGGSPDITSKACQMEKFYSIVKNTIGPYNLLISADIDGVDNYIYRHVNGDASSSYVEIKLHKKLSDPGLERKFKRNNLRSWWAQSVCSGTKNIICGFRDENGEVRNIKVYRTSDLPGECSEWSPKVCTKFCLNILHYLWKNLTVSDPRILYRCKFTGGLEVSVSREENPRGPLSLIPDWYEDELKRWASESTSS